MAVLDGAQDDVIYTMLDDAFQDKFCLLGGDLPWPLPRTAPYLVQLERNDRFTGFLIERGWGHNWGFFLRTGSSPKVVRHHLRHFLLVRDEANQRLIFRFYDPRIMRQYLPLCSIRELRTFLGPSWDYLMESVDGRSLEQFRIEDDECRRDSFGPHGGEVCPFRHPTTTAAPGFVPPPGANSGGWRIRKSQMQAFQEGSTNQFRERLLAHLRSAHEEFVDLMSEAEFREFVFAAIERARGNYGLTLENTIGAYVGLALVMGPDFDSQPAIRRALADPLINPDARFERLFAVTTPADWLEASSIENVVGDRS